MQKLSLLSSFFQNSTMFERKITPESFENSRGVFGSVEREISIDPMSSTYMKSGVDPDTGEILGIPSSVPSKKPISGQIPLNNQIQPPFFEKKKFTMPSHQVTHEWINSAALGIFCIALAYLFFLFKNPNPSAFLDAAIHKIDPLEERINDISQNLNELIDQVEDHIEFSSQQKEDLEKLMNTPKKIPLPSRYSKQIEPPTKELFKNISYLGTFVKNDQRHALLSLENKTRLFKTGEPIFTDWHLSYIDQNFVVFLHSSGRQHHLKRN